MLQPLRTRYVECNPRPRHLYLFIFFDRELRLEEEARAAAAAGEGRRQNTSSRVGDTGLQVDDTLMRRLVEYRTARLSEEYGGRTRAQLYKVCQQTRVM